MTRSSLADACDNHFPGDLPAVHPHTVLNLGGGTLTAFYRCPRVRAAVVYRLGRRVPRPGRRSGGPHEGPREQVA